VLTFLTASVFFAMPSARAALGTVGGGFAALGTVGGGFALGLEWLHASHVIQAIGFSKVQAGQDHMSWVDAICVSDSEDGVRTHADTAGGTGKAEESVNFTVLVCTFTAGDEGRFRLLTSEGVSFRCIFVWRFESEGGSFCAADAATASGCIPAGTGGGEGRAGRVAGGAGR